jgi:hypothetical protein
MAPFYLSVVIHVVFVLMILFVLPESLSSESRQILSKNAELARAAAKRQDAIDREWEATPRQRADPSERDPLLHNDSSFSRVTGTNVTHSRRRKRLVGNARRTFRKVFSFLQPLTVFAPRELEDGSKDWNLTKVGMGMFLMGCLYVSNVMTTFFLRGTLKIRVFCLQRLNSPCTTMAGLPPRYVFATC